MGDAGHAPGEFTRRLDCGDLGLEHGAQEMFYGFGTAGNGHQLAVRPKGGEDGRLAKLAAYEPVETNIVSEDPVWQARLIAFELRAVRAASFFDFVERSSNVLGLDVGERNRALTEGEIWRAALNSPCFVDDGEGGGESFNEPLESGPVGVFGSVTMSEILA